MKNVYLHKPSGDLYVIAHGDLGRQVGLNGIHYYTLIPVHILVDVMSGEDVPRPPVEGAYAALIAGQSLDLVVTRNEFVEQFELQRQFINQPNTHIDDLMRKFESEGCDATDVHYLVTSALRYTDSMSDSQPRCLLYAMAKQLEPKTA